jgi:hypothetical protein
VEALEKVRFGSNQAPTLFWQHPFRAVTDFDR